MSNIFSWPLNEFLNAHRVELHRLNAKNRRIGDAVWLSIMCENSFPPLSSGIFAHSMRINLKNSLFYHIKQSISNSTWVITSVECSSLYISHISLEQSFKEDTFISFNDSASVIHFVWFRLHIHCTHTHTNHSDSIFAGRKKNRHKIATITKINHHFNQPLKCVCVCVLFYCMLLRR